MLEALNADSRRALEQQLLDRQSGKCFICSKVIDLHLHDGQLDIDHIIPLAANGPDEETTLR
jgi:5-methylcytosine-specific restriction endonuclease McrA